MCTHSPNSILHPVLPQAADPSVISRWGKEGRIKPQKPAETSTNISGISQAAWPVVAAPKSSETQGKFGWGAHAPGAHTALNISMCQGRALHSGSLWGSKHSHISADAWTLSLTGRLCWIGGKASALHQQRIWPTGSQACGYHNNAELSYLNCLWNATGSTCAFFKFFFLLGKSPLCYYSDDQLGLLCFVIFSQSTNSLSYTIYGFITSS